MVSSGSPLLDQLAGEVDGILLDPAFQLGLHLGDFGFVQRHTPPAAMEPVAVFVFRAPFVTPMSCCFSWSSSDGPRLHGGLLLFIRIDRNSFIPSGRDPGISTCGGIMAVDPIQNLAFVDGGGLFLLSPRVPPEQLHTAIRRDPRLSDYTRDAFGVHPVERLPLRWGCRGRLGIPAPVA